MLYGQGDHIQRVPVGPWDRGRIGCSVWAPMVGEAWVQAIRGGSYRVGAVGESAVSEKVCGRNYPKKGRS